MELPNNKSKKNPKFGMIVCPYCGCDAWHIGSLWYKCFLCKATFGGKKLLLESNIPAINRELRNMKKTSEDFNKFFADWFDEELRDGLEG